MSLPSVLVISREMEIGDVNQASDEQCEILLVEAMRRDLPLAVDHLLKKAVRVMKNDGQMEWENLDPASPLGKQLARIHTDALRPLAQKHFCHGLELSLLNCCGDGVSGKKPKLADLIRLQIKMQDGTIARADC